MLHFSCRITRIQMGDWSVLEHWVQTLPLAPNLRSHKVTPYVSLAHKWRPLSIDYLLFFLNGVVADESTCIWQVHNT